MIGIDLIPGRTHIRGIVSAGYNAIVKFARTVYNTNRRKDGAPASGRQKSRESDGQEWQKTVLSSQEEAMTTTPISSFSLAREICERSGWKVTNLALQKIIYLLHMFYTGTKKKMLVAEQFEAWDHGPVIPELYHKLKGFGANPVRDIFFSAPEIKDSEIKEILDINVPKLLAKSPAQLIAVTHQPLGAWFKRYRSGVRHVAILQSDIVEEFDERAKRYAKSR